MKIYYVANARMPNEKAHGIQIAKMCEAFLSLGVDLELVVPRRKRATESVEAFYHLRHPIPITYLPVLDWYTKGRIAFALSSLTFIASYFIYLGIKILRREHFMVYTIDMDTFSSAPLGLLPRPFFSELHGERRSHMLTRFFFSHAAGIVAINEYVADIVRTRFSVPRTHILVEQNGVDLALFGATVTVSEARGALALPPSQRIALYVGRLYAWKALDILRDVALLLPEVQFYVVGGTQSEYMEVTGVGDVPTNMVFCGAKDMQDIPLWTAAADVLLVVGTVKNEWSARFTSPMKAFEYMASGRPVVASATPALMNMLDSTTAFLYEPDNATDVARAIEEALGSDGGTKTARARALAQAHSWEKRAERIVRFMGYTAERKN